MFMLKLNFKYYMLNWKRFLLFICLAISLCFVMGVLGRYFLYSNKSIEPIKIIIVDNDNSSESKMFYNTISDMNEYKKIIIFEKHERNNALQLLETNKATAIFIIPKNFTENVKNGKNKSFPIIYNSTMQMKTTLIKFFANSLTQMLKASQIGVYSALDYTSQESTQEDYYKIYRGVNLRYLNITLGRSQIIASKDVSVIKDTNSFQYYFFVAYVFIMIASAILFSDIIQKNYNRYNQIRLAQNGVNSIKIALGNILSVFIVMMLITIVFGGFVFFVIMATKINISLNPFLFLYIPLVLLTISSFTVFISSFFKTMLSTGVFISLFSIVSLFLSGGIVPVEYFSPLFNFISKLTFNFWAVNLLNDGMNGYIIYDSIIKIFLFLIIFLIAAILSFWSNSKAGDKI